MSRTASGAAFCRLLEQSQASDVRQFVDPVVVKLVDPMLAVMASAGPMQDQVLDSMAPGVYGGMVMRTRYIDEVVNAWAEMGKTQVVILGAGLDTRAYRLPSLAGVTVFEADLPEIQRHKQGRLHGLVSSARAVRYVPIDFNTQPLDEALGAAGFDAGTPALFVWEGVTQYLPEPAVRATLAYVAGSAPGSWLVFTYILDGLVGQNSYPGWSGALKQQFDSAEPWLFGLDPHHLSSFLDAFGLALLDDVGDAEYQDRYLNPIGRALVVSAGERVALAVVRPS
ncbi:MAG: class I SAM-dependent methyltransferase [Micropruina sp.]